MQDIKNMNIWKTEKDKGNPKDTLNNIDITELNLSVRSYNCLKRAGCHTVGDILPYIEEEGQGLRRIRNLGSRSEAEIIERVEEMKELYAHLPQKPKTHPHRRLIKAGKHLWDMQINRIPLSKASLEDLQSCGIRTIGDIYQTDPEKEPGWYAVRELFERIMTN